MLSDIVLVQVTEERFKPLRQAWSRNRNNGDGAGIVGTDVRRHRGSERLIEVITPLVSDDYRDILRRFADHTLSYKVAVNKRGNWRKYYKDSRRGFGSKVIDEIAEIAEQDKFKINHFELYFWDGADPKDRTNRTPRLRFMEHNNKIVSYNVLIPFRYASAFTWQSDFSECQRFFGYVDRARMHEFTSG